MSKIAFTLRPVSELTFGGLQSPRVIVKVGSSVMVGVCHSNGFFYSECTFDDLFVWNRDKATHYPDLRKPQIDGWALLSDVEVENDRRSS